MANAKTIGFFLVSIILAIVIITTVIGDTIDDVQTAGDGVTACAATHPTYNATDDLCWNTTHGIAPTNDDLPLRELFNGQGILVLALLAGVFIAVLGIAFKSKM